MPIFEQGYRHWDGQRSGHAWRWLTIARHGIRTQFRGRWIKIIGFSAWFPAIALASALALWGLVEQKAAFIQPFLKQIQGLPGPFKDSPTVYRGPIWTLAFYLFFQVEMTFWMLIVLLVGQGLVSQDLRFNAIPLYFSRPLRRIDYFAGKLGVIAFYLGMVTVVPMVLAWVLGICFSLDATVIPDTARILGAGIAYSAVVILSAGTLILALSSLSRNSLYVGLLWVGLWIVSHTVAAVLAGTLRQRWCPAVSYVGNLERIGAALLDTKSAWATLLDAFQAKTETPAFRALLNPYPWIWSATILAAILALSVWVLSLRVRSLDRLK